MYNAVTNYSDIVWGQKYSQIQFSEFLNKKPTPDRNIVNYKYIPKYIRQAAPYMFLWSNIYQKDKDGLIQIVGDRGDCKSGTALRMAFDFDIGLFPGGYIHRFNLAKVVFLAKDVVELFQMDLPAGTVIVWDEAGVDNSSSSSYMDQKNKILKALMETSRYKNYVLLMTAPVLSSIQANSRRLLNAYIEMQGKVPGMKGWAKGKFHILSTNKRTGEQYYMYPRYHDKWGNEIQVRQFFSKIMPKKIEKAYKKKKNTYVQQWYNLFDRDLEYMQEYTHDAKKKGKNLDKLKKDIRDEIEKFWDVKKQKINTSLIQYNLDVPYAQARVIASGINQEVELGKLLLPTKLLKKK